MKLAVRRLVPIVLLVLTAARARSDSLIFNTGFPDGKMATASRPSSGTLIEIESADDFILPCDSTITSATFVGLIPSSESSPERVVIEIYRVFPADSDTNRTPSVPTRINSPADSVLTSRDSGANELTFTTTVLNSNFTALNSVVNGINKSLTPFTGGEGAVTGREIEFDVTFTSTLSLSAGHYFFIPQVLEDSGNFLWLSAPKPIVSGTPFASDLQSWIRNENLAPDWLRIGTDITHQGPFNGTFSLTGTSTPLTVQASVPSPLVAALGVPIAPVTFTPSGGTSPYTFEESGALPGLSFDGSTGVLSGTPNTTGNFPITVTAFDAFGCSSSETPFEIIVQIRPGIPAPGAAGAALFLAALAGAGLFALRR